MIHFEKKTYFCVQTLRLLEPVAEPWIIRENLPRSISHNYSKFLYFKSKLLHLLKALIG